MPTTLSKDAVLMLGGTDISGFVNSVTFTQSADSLDVTTYGNDGHRKRGGLTDGSISVDGVYDTGATGPRDVVKPLVGTVATFDWRPEGTGPGLPSSSGNVLVQSYVEEGPAAEIISFSVSLEIDGDVTDANQI